MKWKYTKRFPAHVLYIGMFEYESIWVAQVKGVMAHLELNEKWYQVLQLCVICVAGPYMHRNAVVKLQIMKKT